MSRIAYRLCGASGLGKWRLALQTATNENLELRNYARDTDGDRGRRAFVMLEVPRIYDILYQGEAAFGRRLLKFHPGVNRVSGLHPLQNTTHFALSARFHHDELSRPTQELLHVYSSLYHVSGVELVGNR